jgi:hypothetical protein
MSTTARARAHPPIPSGWPERTLRALGTLLVIAAALALLALPELAAAETPEQRQIRLGGAIVLLALLAVRETFALIGRGGR